MKFCPKCGKELNDELIICDSCGFDFDSMKETSAKKNVEQRNDTKVVESNTQINYGWIIASVCSFIMSCTMIYKGYDKFSNYYSSENYSSINVNAYVGGDAYNYIINANYTTGFYVLATLFAILGIGFLVIHYLAKKDNR